MPIAGGTQPAKCLRSELQEGGRDSPLKGQASLMLGCLPIHEGRVGPSSHFQALHGSLSYQVDRAIKLLCSIGIFV